MGEDHMPLVLDFIAENWDAFVQYCEDHQQNPEEVYEALGGEN